MGFWSGEELSTLSVKKIVGLVKEEETDNEALDWANVWYKWSAILRSRYPGIDIEALNDQAFRELVAGYRYVRDRERMEFKNDVLEIFKHLLG